MYSIKIRTQHRCVSFFTNSLTLSSRLVNIDLLGYLLMSKNDIILIYRRLLIVVPIHTCESKVFYDQAIHTSRRHVKLNLDDMNTLLVILKETPLADPRIFCPLVLKYIHHKQPPDSSFIRNFWHYIMLGIQMLKIYQWNMHNC